MESSFFHRILKKPPRGDAAARGFTLIEMLVVLVIIIIITSIALAGQSGFTRTSALNNAAYDIALSIRGAQSYGLATFTVGSANSPYGISFAKVTPTKYVLFADTYPTPGKINRCYPTSNSTAPDARSGNCHYDAPTPPLPDLTADTTVQTYTLNNGYRLSAFCAKSAAGSIDCTQTGPGIGAQITNLSVTFARPNSDTKIEVNLNPGGWSPPGDYTSACIQVQPSSLADYRYISVSQTGQVQAGISTASKLLDPSCAPISL